MGIQAWVCGQRSVPRPDRESLLPVVRNHWPGPKPRGTERRKSGGMWTSTFHERFGSAWIQWCLSEEFDCDRSDPRWHTWLLTPAPEARIFQIDSYADLEHLVDAYPHERAWTTDPSMRERYPAWELVAQDYDGVHLTDGGQWQTRLSEPLNLLSWDCESTLWLRWSFAEVADGGLRRYEYEADDAWCERSAG